MQALQLRGSNKKEEQLQDLALVKDNTTGFWTTWLRPQWPFQIKGKRTIPESL